MTLGQFGSMKVSLRVRNLIVLLIDCNFGARVHLKKKELKFLLDGDKKK